MEGFLHGLSIVSMKQSRYDAIQKYRIDKTNQRITKYIHTLSICATDIMQEVGHHRR